MRHYYFHIRDGLFLVPDEEGMDCRNMSAVQAEARASNRDLAKVAARSGSIPASIEIEDEDGNELSVAWVH